MFGLTTEAQLAWANEIRIWAMVAAALGAVVTLGAGYAQIRLQSVVSAKKDEALRQFQQEATERTARLTADAEASRLEQDKIRKENLGLSIELEKAKAAHLALEGKIASRHLTKEQIAAITKALRDSDNPGPITVTTLGDKEAGDYGAEIVGAIRDSGKMLTINTVGVMAPPRYGLIVSPADKNNPLVIALNAAGVQFSLVGGTMFPSLFVGLKPPAL
ncbi:MAG: hypothetical protein ACRCV5_05075 [Afipia sp.]